jgi:D-threo-aldose 1-dehydrogenase
VGLTLPSLGFGTAPIGGLYQAVGEDDALATIDAAWEAGIRFYDTAPHYGLGLAERRLGRALAGRPRDELVLSTKVGRLLVPNASGQAQRDTEGFDVVSDARRQWDFTRDGVRRSLAASLDRLGLDRVDVVLLHDPDEHWRTAVSEGYPALAELRAEGVVRAIGAGMNQWQMLADFVREVDLDLVLVAGRYTLLDQSAAAELLPLCAKRGVTVVAGGVFNSGLLADGDPGAGARFDYREAPADLLDRARAIAAVCARHGVSLPQAALAFPPRHPAVASVLVGMRSAAEVAENMALARRPVPSDLWPDLIAAGLLSPAEPRVL